MAEGESDTVGDRKTGREKIFHTILNFGRRHAPSIHPSSIEPSAKKELSHWLDARDLHKTCNCRLHKSRLRTRSSIVAIVDPLPGFLL